MLILRKMTQGFRSDSGMITAEYAVGTVAAAGFAGLLLKILTSFDVHTLLLNLFVRVLKSIFG